MKTIEDLFKDSKERDKHNELPRNVYVIRGGRMTDTRTNGQGAANPLAFEYNKRSEVARGLERLCWILEKHVKQLGDFSQAGKAVDGQTLDKLPLESKWAEAIARAVCDYVVDHPDDSVVTDELKKANSLNETLRRYQHNGKTGNDVVQELDRVFYWQHFATVDIELQKALSCIPATAAANSQAQGETTPQKQGNKPQQVPHWATTDVAQRAFAKAMKRGYMRPSAYGYKWELEKVLLAYFVERLAKADKNAFGFPNAEACKFFDVKVLKTSQYSYQTNKGKKPIKSRIIDDLFL